MCSIKKKGDYLGCENYTGIFLLNVVYVIFTTILKDKLESYAENILGDYHADFRRSRSTVNNKIFVTRQMTQTCWVYDIEVYPMNLDFKK